MTYQEFLEQLAERQETRVHLGLERSAEVLQRLQNPHQRYPVVHIAGTNGKGSTGALLAALLRGASYRVGHYTSPHLINFTERIAINGQSLSHADCAKFGSVVLTAAEGVPLTYFEVATALGFVAFAEMAPTIDVAIIETGLGGRLDATNVVSPAVSVLTPIGRDHESWLGSSLAAIAREKCGIIKPGVPVVSAPQGPEVAEVIVETCHRLQSPLIWAPPLDDAVPRGLAGDHQQMNASVAWAVAERLMQCGWRTMTSASLADARWPGRCEWLRKNPPVLFDGAHNPHGAAALAKYLTQIRNGRTIVAVVAGMADKDWNGIIAALSPVVDRWICVPLDHPRALPAENLHRQLESVGCISAVGTLDSALANQTSEWLTVVCGSLTLYQPAMMAVRNT